ncbi:hypothetical protein [Prescottella equi]|uniref:hypothetical protein n=1 Tax=Rhodococcus hoagii TaxID=43767 RepID=UPI0009BF6763|nr:hypothetical protein [Prescottella equi]NKS84068.1 hypothetical protein [Prescottella equi]OQQ38470.1 hypothetical protein A6409_00775 [Prescottella equi]
MDGEYAMPYRNPPRTEVPPEFRGPDFLTADLPPSARPGHPPADSDTSARRARAGAVRLVDAVVVASGLFPGGLTWWCSRSTTDGLVVGGFTAVCTAIAAFAIGRPTA